MLALVSHPPFLYQILPATSSFHDSEFRQTNFHRSSILHGAYVTYRNCEQVRQSIYYSLFTIGFLSFFLGITP